MARKRSAVKDAAELAVFHHALVGVAEEMGEVLKRTAYSPNIKERQDYSCALFDAKGRLLAQAAHLPVHLGSMPASVKAILDREGGVLGPGDYGIVNDPYKGGTHLPDITMVLGSHENMEESDNGRSLIGFAASRAHHADIGGAAPGSMAPQVDLFAEGLIIEPNLIERDSSINMELWSLILANTRTPIEREGDLWAQFAACDKGAFRLDEIQRRFGRRRFNQLCEALMAHSRRMMVANLRGLRLGTYRAKELLEDDGAGTRDIPICLKLTVSRKGLRFDFTGSAPQVRGGVNAVLAVTQSAAFYAALCFCETLPPINHGCFECIEVIAPEGTVVNARRPAPVAGGNVETSQRLVDLCLAALSQAAPARAVAQSQGTMNNLTMGGARSDGSPFTYYETIAGGCGADARDKGASATHSHMTNTLNTPVEALEHAYPLRVEEYALREQGAGTGAHLGGLGVLRRVRALGHAQFGLLTERRRLRPHGVNGGGAGASGENTLVRANGTRVVLPAKCQGELAPGEALEIKTPGGGGVGKAR